MRPLLPILRALRDAEVDFVVVGGVAVVLHGHPRMTIDLDVVVDLERENVQRAMEALTAVGLRPRLPVDAASFADPGQRRAWIEQRNLTVFSLHDPADPRREVDVFAEPPLPWERLVAGSTTVDVDGVDVRVASRADLITMKQAAGRPQDLADVAALQALVAEDEDLG